MEEEIKVSICCTVYNHEKYLRKCLDGFVMQKTNFAYEVLIHDDASTDHSADIIREYEQKYPNIIKPIYQTENQYSKGVRISWVYQYPRARGKYIALCEGDDYWCDENKLQAQFDAMEEHPEVVFCACRVQEVSEDDTPKERFYPQEEIQTKQLSQNEVFELIISENNYPFQTSSYFIKKEMVDSLVSEQPKFVLASPVGDVPLILFCLSHGEFIYINRVMSHYRLGGIGSWNSRQTNESRINNYLSGIAMLSLYEVYTKHSFSDYIEKLINRERYYYYYLRKEYRVVIRKEYRHWFSKEPVRQRAYCILCAVFPRFEIVYKKLKSTRERVSNNGKKD